MQVQPGFEPEAALASRVSRVRVGPLLPGGAVLSSDDKSAVFLTQQSDAGLDHAKVLLLAH